jgi:uncharacterized protein DUF4149
MPALYQFIQIIYWLGLATWFGCVLFIAVTWPVIFSTVREANPVLPTVLSVNLEGQHGTLLAGTIVANLIARLTRIQLICAGALLITIAIQLGAHWQDYASGIPRLILYLAAVGLLVYDWWFIEPKIHEQRKQYLDHADEPEAANAARQEFDRYHRQSVLLMYSLLGALLGIIVFSTTINPALRAFLAG